MNTRLMEALRALATHEGDVRSRVAVACRILERMHCSELSPPVMKRIKSICDKAGEKGALRDINDDVLRDRYDNTFRTKHKKTYKRLAEELYDICRENLPGA